MKMIFYPKLERRLNYTKNTSGEYFNYSYYYDAIEEDCQGRCVYCDSTRSELGGDPLQLDHFKPQDLFLDLKNNPYNLVTACAACNRSKSNSWFLNKDSSNGYIIFVDPFIENYLNYIEITDEGEIIPKKDPAKYFVKILKLNRKAKINLRLKRVLQNKFDTSLDKITILTEKIQKDFSKKGCDLKKIKEKFDKLNKYQKELNMIKKEIDDII